MEHITIPTEQNDEPCPCRRHLHGPLVLSAYRFFVAVVDTERPGACASGC